MRPRPAEVVSSIVESVAADEKDGTRVLAVLCDNEAGVLSRVAGGRHKIIAPLGFTPTCCFVCVSPGYRRCLCRAVARARFFMHRDRDCPPQAPCPPVASTSSR